jgi:hypothetical protein
MRVRGWVGAAIILAVVFGVTGCTGLSSSRVREVLASIAKTPGVLRETHVQDSAAGYCQQTCYQGSATLVVSSKLSENRVLAIRDQIAGTLEAAHIDGFAMTLTLQQGSSHITLDATHAQYGAWVTLRHINGMSGVNMEASHWILSVTNRATIVVTATSRSTLIPVLRSSAKEISSSGLFGKRVFLTARTPNVRYYLAVDALAKPLPFLALDQQVVSDSELTGGSVDKSPLGGHGLVGIRVPALADVPDAYLRYDGIVAAYPLMYVHTVEFPGGIVELYGHLPATDPVMIALRQIIATNAHLSAAQIQQVAGRPTTLSVYVPSATDAALVKSVFAVHPELTGSAFCQIASYADLPFAPRPDTGIGDE